MSGNSEAERANGMARSQWIVAGIAGVVLAFGVAFGDSAIVRMLAAAAGGGALLWLCLRDKGERPQTEAPAPESIAQETPAPEVHAPQMPEPHPDPETDPEPAISEAPPAPQLGAGADSHSESNGDGAAIQGLVRAKIGTGDQALDVHHGALNRFMSSGPANIVLLDETGVVLEYSQAFSDLAGVSVTLIGNTVASLFEEDAQVAVLDALTVFLAGVDAAAPLASLDDPLEGPLIARLATGPKETCAVIFSELQSNPRIIALSLLNVTQEKKLEAQFAQSQKMLAVGQLAGGIAHDFNNLLTAIIGHCDLLMLRHSPSDESFADINQVKQNANRAANLVRQLLAFSRRQTLQPQVLDVGDVLSDLGNLLNRLLGAAVVLNIRHGRDLALVKVDRVQLEQVVINLAVNARDAMDARGSLEIVTKMAVVGDTVGGELEPMPAGEYVQIDVIDSGTGIEKEHLKRIFEPFFTTKDVGKGTGLGLSTVYGIVKQTGGFVFVDSRLGEGTRFSVYLPTNNAEASIENEEDTAKPLDLTGVGTVMLVEDEDPVRLFGARALRGKGYRVIEAATGGAALKLFQEGEADDIDLLVTDIVMPEIDGPRLIVEARRIRPDLPVICVSGYAESEFREQLAGLENVHFLPKPFTLQQLAGTVKRIIR